MCMCVCVYANCIYLRECDVMCVCCVDGVL